MSEQKKQNLANSSVRKDLLLICLTEKLSENGYRINVLDISDPKHSEKYNPLRCINSDDDIKALVTCILKNTNSGENKDLLFETAESSLLSAVFFYLTRHCEIEKRTLREACRLCTAALL